jgi:hypothetical protein
MWLGKQECLVMIVDGGEVNVKDGERKEMLMPVLNYAAKTLSHTPIQPVRRRGKLSPY